MPKIVFDLDGTLTDPTHREHFVRRPVGQKDWDSFFAAQSNDPPKLAIVALIEALDDAGFWLEIWTGRPEKYRGETELWLSKNEIPYEALLMREDDDKTDDHELKLKWCEEFGKPFLVFEDRQRLVDMYRSIGVTCCQVAPGDF